MAAKVTISRRAAPAPAPKASAPTRAGKSPGTAWPADRVERRSVASLVPYARNARQHSAAQISQIAASIREWGWTIPVLIDEDGGLIAGHGRVMAAKLLRLKDVPVMTARGWSDAKKRAYVLADNKLAEQATWDADILANEIAELTADEFDMSLIGFLPAELEKFSAKRSGDPEPDNSTDGDLDGKVCCPSCGHEFQTVAKAFRLIAAKKAA